MSDMTPPPAAPMMGGPSSNAKLIALLGWIFAPLGVIALFLDDYKDDMWVKSNVIQGAAVAIVGWILGMFTFGLGSLAAFIIQIVYAIQAYNGKTVEVPVVYGLVKGMISGN
jgi:uncharacterized membrane protein